MKILFICHGNICRSPMAEFVMKDLAEKQGLLGCFEIESAATSHEEIMRDYFNGVDRGNPVYPPARKKLAEHGIDCSGKTARQVVRADYDRFDMLVCMDSKNVRNLQRIIGADPEGKVSLLLDHCGRAGQSVADPWYTGDFDAAWDDILEGCTALLEECKQAAIADRRSGRTSSHR